MSNSNDKGGHAFPCNANNGMSLRDWFAGQVIAGLMADPETHTHVGGYAQKAYEIADAMLAERSKS